MEHIRRRKNLIFAVILGLIYGAVALFYGALSSDFTSALFISYLHSPLLVVFNIFPAVLLILLFWLLFSRLWAAALFGGLIIATPCAVAYTKMLLRNDPLIAKDLSVFAEAATASETYTDLLSAPIIALVLLILALTTICAKFFPERLALSRCRIIAFFALIATAVGSYFAVYASEDIYECTENIERNSWFMSSWSAADQFASRGLIYPFLHSFTDLYELAPEGYSQSEIEAYLAQFPEATIAEDEQINVFAVMLEAFVDLSVYDLDFTDDAYVNLHRLQSEGLWGNLITDTFSGGTINTERAFLTGQSVATSYRKNAQSYVQYFSDQGYKTEGGHPFYGWFYSREVVNNYIGFDDYWFYETRYSNPQQESYVGVMKDQEFYEDLLGLYDSATADGSPYFSFSTTYQNHSPFYDAALDDTEYVAMGDNLSESGYYIINNYLNGIAEADAAFGYLADELEARDEPVILVLFGDHKPWLGNGSYVYDELGIDISRTDEESIVNYFGTQYLIWANSAARAIIGDDYWDYVGEGEYIPPCFLMNKVFEVAGFETPAYMAAVNEIRCEFNVITNTGVYWQDDEFTTELDESGARAVEFYRELEYYRRNVS